VESVLALMPYERSAVLPKGVASGVLNGGEVGGVLDRGGVGGGIMSLTRSWETDRDLIGGGGRIRVVWRREVIRPTRGQFGDVVLNFFLPHVVWNLGLTRWKFFRDKFGEAPKGKHLLLAFN